MMNLLFQWTLILASAPSNTANYENGPILLEVNIHSSIYTYTITNQETDPVEKVLIPEYAAYNFQVPDGWDKKTEGGLFEAWTSELSRKIRRDRSGEFSMRITSHGAVLGKGKVRVFLSSGKEIVLEDVWGPKAEPPSYRVLLIGLLVLILVFQTFRVVRKKGREAESSS